MELVSLLSLIFPMAFLLVVALCVASPSLPFVLARFYWHLLWVLATWLVHWAYAYNMQSNFRIFCYMYTPSPVTCAVGHKNTFSRYRNLWNSVSNRNQAMDDLRGMHIVGATSLCFSHRQPNVSFDRAWSQTRISINTLWKGEVVPW